MTHTLIHTRTCMMHRHIIPHPSLILGEFGLPLRWWLKCEGVQRARCRVRGLQHCANEVYNRLWWCMAFTVNQLALTNEHWTEQYEYQPSKVETKCSDVAGRGTDRRWRGGHAHNCQLAMSRRRMQYLLSQQQCSCSCSWVLTCISFMPEQENATDG